MKNYSLIKIAAFSAVLLTAMAFSCQDHHVPDPDPVAKCNRVDGSPRAFPCEFEIIKIEYYAGKTNRIIGVVTQKDSVLHLSPEDANELWYYSRREDGFMNYNTKIYVKRLSNPASPAWNKYALWQNTLFESAGSDDNINYPLFSPVRPEFYKQIDNWAIGEIKVFDSLLGHRFVVVHGVIDYYTLNYVSFQNQDTYNVLTAPPYNYEFLREAAESTLYYKLITK